MPIAPNRIARLVVVILLTATVCRTTRALSGQRQASVREIGWDPHARIADRLQPNDDVVLITRQFADVLQPGRPLTIPEVIEQATMRAAVVAVVEVESVRPVVVLNDSWINTRLRGTISRVIRTAGSKAFRTGERIQADYPNGEIMMGHVRVRAVDRARDVIPPFPAHQSYLLFLNVEDDFLFPTHPPLLIREGRLHYLQPFRATNKPADALEGMTVDAVVDIARRAKRLPDTGGVLQQIGR